MALKIGDRCKINGTYPMTLYHGNQVMVDRLPDHNSRFHRCLDDMGRVIHCTENELDRLKPVFYLVWRSMGGTAPRVKHATYEEAETEAKRLSDREPGVDFYVLASVSKVVTTRTVTNTTNVEKV